MLEKVMHVNDLSPELRKHMEEKIDSFGSTVRYKFFISNPDPHPENKGKVVWPAVFTLGPKTFRIRDKYEKRPNASRDKLVGMVKEVHDEKGHPIAYRSIQVKGIHEGFKTLDLEDPDQREECMMLELHPKHRGGEFFDSSKGLGVFQRVDELALARANRSTRQLRLAAQNVVEDFSEQEVRDFISALGREEARDIDILKEELAEMAETQPTLFTEEFNTGNWQRRATLKRALSKQIIVHHPVEDKVTFAESGELVAVLPRLNEADEKTVNHRLAEALQSQGDKGDKMYKRLEALVKALVVA